MKTNKIQKIFSVILLSLLIISGCSEGLEVTNPNNLLEADLGDYTGATGIANGANGTVLQGIGYVYAPYEAATDEVYWIGSRDAWNELDKGNISDYYNEFVDQSWPYISEGRWMADKAVSQLEGFRTANTLINVTDLGRCYLYAGLVRVVIGETFDNFVYSDKTASGIPIGKSKMNTIFDEAIVKLDSAYNIGNRAANADMKKRAMGLKARALHSKAVWTSLNNPEGTVAKQYEDAGATEATSAIALMGATTDYRWKPDYFSVVLFNELAWEIVGRSELQINAAPIDPVTKARDTRWIADSTDFKNKVAYSDRYSPITFTSTKEMHLIVAESQVSKDDFAGAIATLNKIRALNTGLATISSTMSNDSVKIQLKHERRANTLLQGRRLNDMYRWGVKDAKWLPANIAFTASGRLLPITIQERRANANVTDND